MAEVVQPVSIMFGAKPASKKSSKPNPSKVKPVMVQAPMIGHAMEKAPSHGERMHSAAADEHVYNTRKYVAGEISSAEYRRRADRAHSIMSKTPKPKR